MKSETIKPDWNKEYFKGVTKEQFIADHKHYAEQGVDLDRVWDEHQPAVQEKKKADKPSEKA